MTAGNFGITRRRFIAGSAIAAAALHRLPAGAATRLTNGHPGRFVDTNVTLSHWPMRRVPFDEPAAFLKQLRSHGVTQAWASSFEGLLHRDMAGVNARLAENCRTHGKDFWVPFGCVNPALPGWQEDLRRCREDHDMPGVRIFPGYHGYTLAEPRFAEFMDAVQEHGQILQIVITIEDVRVQHSRLQATPVDLQPLPELLASRPRLKVMLLNWNRALNVSVVPALASAGRVWIDIATQESVAGVSSLLKQVPAKAVVFGSHAPYYYFESAWLKLKESEISPGDLKLIQAENASRIMGQASEPAVSL